MALSHMASERISRKSPSRFLALRSSPSDRSTSALPEIAVRGVLKSCEIDLSRLARSCSFLARTAAFSRSSSALARARASDASPATASASLRSAGSGAAPIRQMPMTPTTSVPERRGRYKPDAEGKSFVPTPTLSPSSKALLAIESSITGGVGDAPAEEKLLCSKKPSPSSQYHTTVASRSLDSWAPAALTISRRVSQRRKASSASSMILVLRYAV